jgi:hypothetical protein
MKSIYFTLCLLILFFKSTSGQVLNIDREVFNDSIEKKWIFSSLVTFSSDKQIKTVVDINSNIELDRLFKNKYGFLTLFKNDAVFNGSSTIQNQGLFNFRFRDMDYRKISIESYVQKQWNGAWGMEYRDVIGANVRIKWHEIDGADFYTAHGIFREWERWNWSGVNPELIPNNPMTIKSSTFRFNNYAKISRKLTKSIDFSAISFLQFPLTKNFLQPRWVVDANIYFNVTKHLNIVTHWNHILDQHRLVPIDNFYYSFSTGFQLNY